MQVALRKAESAHPRENAPKAGQIRSLGLIGGEEGSNDLLKQS
jgi:NADH dehydrogenase (ubiquinone) Fe-S protein 5